jgi:hypothetical protein
VLHSKNWEVQFPIGYIELHFAMFQEYTLYCVNMRYGDICVYLGHGLRYSDAYMDRYLHGQILRMVLGGQLYTLDVNSAP